MTRTSKAGAFLLMSATTAGICFSSFSAGTIAMQRGGRASGNAGEEGVTDGGLLVAGDSPEGSATDDSTTSRRSRQLLLGRVPALDRPDVRARLIVEGVR